MGSICSVSVHWGLITLVRAMLKHSSIARTRVLSCDDNKNTTLTLLTYFFYPGIIFLVKVVYKTVAWLILLHKPHQSREKNFLIIKTFWCCWIKSEEPNFATLMKAVKWWLLKGGCQLSDERNFTSILPLTLVLTSISASAPSWPGSSCCQSPESSSLSCSWRPVTAGIVTTVHWKVIDQNLTESNQ